MKLSIEVTPDEVAEIIRTLTMTQFTSIRDISDTMQHVENVNRQSLRQQRRMANAIVRLARNFPMAYEDGEPELEEEPVQEFDDGR